MKDAQLIHNAIGHLLCSKTVHQLALMPVRMPVYSVDCLVERSFQIHQMIMFAMMMRDAVMGMIGRAMAEVLQPTM